MKVNHDIKISVILLINNDGQSIRRCLNSLINQTFEDFEIICVDCGSTDESLIIVDEFSKLDKRIKILKTKSFSYSLGRNLGLKICSGNFISFIRATDYVKVDFLEILYEFALIEDLDIVYCSINNPSNFNHQPFLYFSSMNNFDTGIYNLKTIESPLFDINNDIVGKLYRKEVIEIDSFSKSDWVDDLIFFYNILLNSKYIGHINKTDLYFKKIITKNIFDYEEYCLNIQYLNELLSLFIQKKFFIKFKEDLINYSFSIICHFLEDIPIYYSNIYFNRIKKTFLGFNDLSQDFLDALNSKNLLLFQSFLNNDFYGFISDFYHYSTDYEIVHDSLNNNYKISIVISGNSKPFEIHRLLSSFFCQEIDFDVIECIFFNNFNSKMFDCYSDFNQNFKVINLDKNINSIGIQRNIAINESSAEYILFLDESDFFDKFSLTKLMDDEIRKFDIIFGNFYHIINNDLIYNEFTNISIESFFEKNYLNLDNTLIGNMIFNKNFLIKNNLKFHPFFRDNWVFIISSLINSNNIYEGFDLICYHDFDRFHNPHISLNNLLKLLLLERHLFNLFNKLDNDYYLKISLNFFINSFLGNIFNCLITKIEIKDLVFISKDFLKSCILYDIQLSGVKRDLFNYLLEEDVDNIYYLVVRNYCTNDDVDNEINLFDAFGRFNSLKFDKNFNSDAIINLIRNKSKDIIVESNLFDYEYYLKNYFDVNFSSMDPIDHFLKFGSLEFCNPNSFFDLRWYNNFYHVEDKLNINPFVHYILFGQFDGYFPNFDDLVLHTVNLYSHNQINSTLNSLNNKISIIIPIYNAFESLKACIESIMKFSSIDFELILIDDKSTDERIKKYLNKLKCNDNINVIFNEYNEGFVKNVNLGISLSENDVILLNSDTIVTPRWLQKLVISAYSKDYVGTVTPLSNSAGAFSVPEVGNNIIPRDLDINQMSNIVEKSSNNLNIISPTGNGFCLYIKRDTINDVGIFDEEQFEKGYGEENDFCMRAIKNGWVNFIDDSTYIYHENGVSFNDKKNTLIKAHAKILKEKYPNYSNEVQKFLNNNNFQIIRNNLKNILISNNYISFKKRILYFSSSFNRNLFDILQDNYICIIAILKSNFVHVYEYSDNVLTLIENYYFNSNYSINEIQYNILLNFKIDWVFINNINISSLSLLNLAKKLGISIKLLIV